MNSAPTFKRTLLVTAICATVVTPSLAQQLEEIVVTAQFRAENVQDVPISVTALGADELADAEHLRCLNHCHAHARVGLRRVCPGAGEYFHARH